MNDNDLTRFGKFLRWLMGPADFQRFSDWLEKGLNPPRCEWISPNLDRCRRPEKHSGQCVTKTVIMETVGGTPVTRTTSWYGINYRKPRG